MSIRSLLFILLTLRLLAFMPLVNAAENDVSLGDKTKAVFLYHFTKFIQWPKVDSNQDFHIAIIGDSKILTPLQEIKSKKKVGGREIRITHHINIPDSLDCHILFISSLSASDFHSVVSRTKDRNILTVGDTRGYCKRGIMVNFILVDGKIKFEVNGPALDKSDLRISAQLLKLADIVQGAVHD